MTDPLNDAPGEQAPPLRENPLALSHLASQLRVAGRPVEAEIVCREALALQPRNPDILNTLGTILEKLKRFDEAEGAYRYALSIRPQLAEAQYNLGIVLEAQGRVEDAEASYRAALGLRPGTPEALNNLGGVLAQRGRQAEAVECYRQALAARPDLHVTWYNLGSVLKNVARLDEAEAAYRQALALVPDYADAQFGLATLLLSLGRYEEGWKLYDARYALPRYQRRRSEALLSCPRWRGEPLEGRALLVWQEDGLGDMIQFGRYLARLKGAGAGRVTVACLPSLHRLMRPVDGVDEVVTHAEAQARAPEFAHWVSPMSLPLWLQSTDPSADEASASAAYLCPDAALVEAWRPRLDDALPTGLRAALVWKGNPMHTNDAFRSLPSLAALAPLWEAPGVGFVSLQKGEGEDEASMPPVGQPLLSLGGEASDLADTAAIVAQLDLVICVDTAIAHLAASLGKPCWIMLPAQDIDWRWMHGRDDSPWYPGVRLFRQDVQGRWETVIRRVGAALAQQAACPSLQR